ncbi:hypothetical protein [Mycobacterium sp. NPDC050853]|uniref:hypothetical protein n=1 Tax=Mycobacterium sp. NPDC050853 TaxID=3155160 RepID=UPI0033E51CAE
MEQYEAGAIDLYKLADRLERVASLLEATDDHVAIIFRGTWIAIETVNAMQLYDLEKGERLTADRIQEDDALVERAIGEMRMLLNLDRRGSD